MAVIKFLRDITGLFNWSTDENPTSQQDYQNAVKNWQETEKNLVDAVLWQPETAYDAGNQVRTPSLPSECVLVCTTAGTSGANEPDYTSVVVGDTVADGTAEWLVASSLTSAGGRLSGALTLSDGGTALSNATVGTTVSDSLGSSTSVTANTGKKLCSVSLTKGVWVVTGHAYFSGLTADKVYGIALEPSSGTYAYAHDSSLALMTSTTGAFAMQTARIVTMAAAGSYYLNAYCNVAATVTNADMNAVRIA